MAIEVKMPRLSLTMESGVVVQWLKAVGEAVGKGEELAEIETDKVNVMMESPASGFVRKLLAEVGKEIPCDTTIAIVTATVDEELDGQGAPAPPPVPSPSVPPPAPQGGGRAHVNASPAAKNLARQLGVDLSTVAGTGPGGRIGLEDVQRAVEAARAPADATPQPSAGTRRVPLCRMRAAIAGRMTAALAAPQFTVRRRVDMSGVLRQRAALEGGTARAPGVADMVYLAVIRALRAHPELNAGFEPGATPESSHLLLHDAVHLGVALAVPDGLLVPVIRDAHTLDLAALAAARRRLQEEAMAGRLPAQALDGATFTVSNLGTMGVDEFTAIVTPPEVAILAVGRLQHDLVVRDGAIHTLPLISLTVTADHRALDGAQVARFLDTLATYLEHPDAPAT